MSRVSVLTGSQLRAARGLINLSVSELAERTGLAINTIRRAEGTNGPSPITAANMKLLSSAFDEAGVLFIPADELGPGVRLKTPEITSVQSRRRDAPQA
jgi:transcriptional regulator with XRE-family HTH domain